MKVSLITFLLILSSNLLAEGRDSWQKPDLIFKTMSLKPASLQFCEIGAGEGYFSIKAAKIFKNVYSSEIDSKSIELIKKKVKKMNMANIKVIKSEALDPLFPVGECDIIFMGMVYHHLEQRVEYLKNLRQYLTKKGKIFNLDNMVDLNKYKGSGKRVPAKSCRFPKKTFLDEVKRAGYYNVEEFKVLQMQYFIGIN